MGFENLLSNNKIKKRLKAYLQYDLMPHSMIFSAPSSANSFDFAKGIAKSLNCLNESEDFCDSCKNCTEINKEIFPDVKIISPDGAYYNKKQIKDFISDNAVRPLKGKKKIYILKEAHLMNEATSNSLLKVIEEPALFNLFILLTNNINGIIPTILSRCQNIKFSPPLKVEIENQLIERGEEKDKARVLSYLINMNMETILSTNHEELLEKRANIFLVFEKLIRQKNIPDVLLDLTHRSRSREKFIRYFVELVNLTIVLIRDLIVLKIDSNNESLINIDYKKVLLDLSELISINKALFLIKKMELLFRDISRNLNSKVLILEFIKNFASPEKRYV